MKKSILPLVAMILSVVVAVVLIIVFPTIAREVLESSFLENSTATNYPFQTVTDNIIVAGIYLLGQMIIGSTGIICFLISLRWYVKIRKNIEVKE